MILSGTVWIFARTGAQRYPVSSYGSEFLTGDCWNGDQVIIGLLGSNIALYRFDRQGEFIGRKLRPSSGPAEPSEVAAAVGDPVFQERVGAQFTAWKTELGFAPQLVKVEQFYDAELCVGIELPDHACAFIFQWGREYRMNSNGEVQST